MLIILNFRKIKNMLIIKPNLLKPVLILLLCFTYLTPCFSQSQLFSYQKYISANNDTLNYRQLWPDANALRKYPLVIFLHGSGEKGTDNEAQLKWGVLNFADAKVMQAHPAIVIAPQCPPNMGWANFINDKTTGQPRMQPQPSKQMQLLYELIQKIKATLPVDTNRIYITGLSMGGHGTYDLIERYPDLFAAAVPVCGSGDTSKAASIAHIPIWIFHGAEDPVVSPLRSLDMLTALTNAGAHPGFTQYPETGHFSWIAAYSDSQMLEWMFRQSKKR